MKHNRVCSIVIGLISLILSSCETQREPLNHTASSDSFCRLGENMKQSRDYGTAIRLYQQALKIDPHSKQAHVGLIETFVLEGKIDEGRQHLEKLLKETPDDEDFLNELGKIAIIQNDVEICLGTYQKLLKKNPKDVKFLNGFGVCHDLNRNHTKAQMIYKEALSREPDNISVKSNLGLSLALSGKCHQAIDLLANLAHRTDATATIRHNLAVAYGLAGHLKKARHIFANDLDSQDLEHNMAVLKSLLEYSSLHRQQNLKGKHSQWK